MNNKELVITRIIDAPREMVWKAWTEPQFLMHWWGPKDFTAPVCRIDFRVGGKYIFCMRSPDGNDFWSTGEYKEIIPQERISCTDCFADENGNAVPASYYGMKGDFPLELLLTVAFEQNYGMTKMNLQHDGFPSGTVRDLALQSWNESLDKLVESVIPVKVTR
jgi:uncharacterized protein YndB with AHSA1/START domain